MGIWFNQTAPGTLFENNFASTAVIFDAGNLDATVEQLLSVSNQRREGWPTVHSVILSMAHHLIRCGNDPARALQSSGKTTVCAISAVEGYSRSERKPLEID